MEPTKKISYKSLTEKMSDEMLKAIIAGCGVLYDECCECSWTITCDGIVEEYEGTICGEQGSDCRSGIPALMEKHEAIWDGCDVGEPSC